MLKTVSVWGLTIFFAFGIAITFPSISSIFSLLAVLLLLPISKWQSFLSGFLNGKLRVILIIIAILLTFLTAPNTDPSATLDNTESDLDTGVVEVIEDETPEFESEENNFTTETATEADTIVKEETSENATEAEIITELETEPESESETVVSSETETSEAVTAQIHTHSFTSATCTSPKTCSCGVTEGDANGHNWKAATCTSPKICSVCGERSGSAINHSYSGGKCTYCGAKDPNYVTTTYVLNVESKKFHKLSCHKLPTDNREDTTMSRDQIVQLGYQACKICNP